MSEGGTTVYLVTVAICPFCSTGKLALIMGGPTNNEIHCQKCGQVWRPDP